jgi:hypothetical protein
MHPPRAVPSMAPSTDLVWGGTLGVGLGWMWAAGKPRHLCIVCYRDWATSISYLFVCWQSLWYRDLTFTSVSAYPEPLIGSTT